jgi:hypothetical protein
MAISTYQVEQRPVPGSHTHGWTAVEEETAAEIPLPQGGNGRFLGSYPEIMNHLRGRGVDARLAFSRARGDELEIDHDTGNATWTFRTAMGDVVVKDIPRVVFSLSVDPVQYATKDSPPV